MPFRLACEAWAAGARLRERRLRNKNYVYGNQWSDITDSPDGPVTEGELAAATGKSPLTNNIIRRLVRSMVGNYRLHHAERETRWPVAEEVARRNMLAEIDGRTFEEYLISGCAIQRVVCEKRCDGSGPWVDHVSPERFFVNRFADPRGSDIETVGMLHDMSLREVVMRFGDCDPQKTRWITEQYAMHAQARENAIPLGDGATEQFCNSAPGRCRVIEVWTLESRNIFRCHDTATGKFFLAESQQEDKLKKLNETRAAGGKEPIRITPKVTLRWKGRYFTPTGEILHESDSPFSHGGHPFAVKFYPLTDGEVHSFVEDVIDQQRYINRLVTMIDHVMGVSAKGVLLFPEDMLPTDGTWLDICKRWAMPGAVIPYRPSVIHSSEPRQVTSSGTPESAYRLLDLQMRMIEQVSGVGGAMSGLIPDGKTSAALYENASRNASVALLDLFESFDAFLDCRDRLIAGV